MVGGVAFPSSCGSEEKGIRLAPFEGTVAVVWSGAHPAVGHPFVVGHVDVTCRLLTWNTLRFADVATLTPSPFSSVVEKGIVNTRQHISVLDGVSQGTGGAEARSCQPGQSREGPDGVVDGISSMQIRDASEAADGADGNAQSSQGLNFPRTAMGQGPGLRSHGRPIAQPSAMSGPQQTFPPYGVKAICGSRPRMEDAYKAVPFLLDVPVPADQFTQVDILPPRLAIQVKSHTNSPVQSADGEVALSELGSAGVPQASESNAASSAPYMETLHFFGVFDGHGGAEAAMHCAQTLHQRIREALSAATSTSSPEPASHEGQGSPPDLEGMESVSKDIGVGAAVGTEEASLVQLQPAPDLGTLTGLPPRRSTSSRRLDGESDDNQEGIPITDMPASDRIESQPCSAETFESALTDAFNRTDEEFAKADNAALVGTTAVVALVGTRQLYVANCGIAPCVWISVHA